jgi:hypothetical protein
MKILMPMKVTVEQLNEWLKPQGYEVVKVKEGKDGENKIVLV